MKKEESRLGKAIGQDAKILGAIFVVLKLTGLTGWSWWWVLSPWWIAFALIFVVVVIALAVRGLP